MDPGLAGVFDDAKLHISKLSLNYSILSPVKAGVFDEVKADLNKPLPPDPTLYSREQRKTFFVVSESVHSPLLPQPLRPQSILPTNGMPVKQFARLSRPFIDPFLIDALAAETMLSSDDEEDSECNRRSNGSESNGREVISEEQDITELPADVPVELPVGSSPTEHSASASSMAETALECRISRANDDESAQIRSQDIESDDCVTHDPPAITLEQAESELMAQLCLDATQKFQRPRSWLAESPTLGAAQDPAMPLAGTVPATALGVGDTLQTSVQKQKMESQYEFLWSPEGWYVA
jgi:hypothetical protein